MSTCKKWEHIYLLPNKFTPFFTLKSRFKKNTINTIFPFLKWWPLVNRSSVKSDLAAGLTNAFVVLPQGVAFAMIAGLPPIYGLYTAMVVPVIAALFGSSFHLISGPTTAISIVVFAAISEFAEPGTAHYIELVLILTLLAGVFQLLMGIARMGSLVNFVSHSVIVGFTTGAAILIATSQLQHALGISANGDGFFVDQWYYLLTHLRDTNLYVLAISLSTLLSAILIKRFLPKLPHMLLGMLIGSFLSFALNGHLHGVTLIGKLPASLPPFHFPEISMETIQLLSPNAFAIALLGLIEAVAIARSIAAKSHQRLNGNQEFIGQGLSNIVGSMFSSYAGSGSFTRSGLNYQSGAKTPMSAIFAAITLALILLLIAPLTAYLPLPAMGGIILLVAYNLIDFVQIKQILSTSKSELIVLIITFLSTLLLDLEFAIYIGVILSLIFYLKRTSNPRMVEVAPNPSQPGSHFQNIDLYHNTPCPQLVMLRIDGSLFFGAIEHVAKQLEQLRDADKKQVLLIANGINFLDLAGSEMLIAQALEFSKIGGTLSICGLKKNVRDIMSKGQYDEKFGKQNIYLHKESAIKGIYKNLDFNWCQNCEARVFTECQKEFGH